MFYNLGTWSWTQKSGNFVVAQINLEKDFESQGQTGNLKSATPV